jgi:predicted lipoprotein with Yx(FWY)xxD motif
MFEAVEVVKVRRGLLSAVAIAALVVLGCGGPSGQGGGTAGGGGAAGGGGVGGGPYGGGGNGGGTPGANLTLSSKPGLGEYLVSPSGRALYYFALDVPGVAGTAPVSNCTGGCLPIWPIFNVDTPVAPAGLSSSDFGQFVCSDGATQTTYKGWPLYYFAGTTRGATPTVTAWAIPVQPTSGS